MHHRGFMSDVTTRQSIISACEKGQQHELARQLLNVTQHRSFLPDVTTRQAVISVCEKGSQPERAGGC